MRPISTNNDLLRHEQDSICDAITLTSDKYETLYAEVKREMRERAILCQSLRTTTAKEYIRQIARVVASRQNSPLQSTAPNSRLRTITHLAVRCNHNATRRMRSKQRKMRCNYNPETRLRNNNRYAKAVVYSARQSNTVNNAPQLSTILVATTEYKDISSLNYTQFIRTLKREVEFKDKRSSIYYYTKTADNTVATKLYRATFVIEPLI
ncbi:hypothetical protein HBH61_241740 [Parastagonospora nodorum]|nr:hypothetical protein HBH61_241740 [Parastagonospora nodorum]